MKVKDAMTPDVRLANPDMSICEAACLMAESDIGALPVGDGDRLVGVITDRDIAVRAVAKNLGPDTPVRDVMSKVTLAISVVGGLVLLSGVLILIGAVAATIAGAIVMLARMAYFAELFGFGGGRSDDRRGGMLSVLAMMIVAPLAALLIQMAISRSREFAADATAAEITGNPYALARALWNLLDNAVKYSPHCKTVWAEAGCENGQVAIRVIDKGLGIAPGERKQIFKKSVRAASAPAGSPQKP